jgi:4-hydroxybenzoate polyprenyltransferase
MSPILRKSMVPRIRLILEMIRFSHTLFALPFALLSASLAWYTKTPQGFQWQELAGIVLCMVFARSAAMAFNRLADRDIDAANPRTAGRHLPTGKLSVPVVWAFTLVCGVGFIASTLIFLAAEPPNPWPLILSVPVLLFICAYSLTKRFTVLAHFWLGASLLLAPVAAWIAIRGLDELATPVVLGLAVMFWVAGFDILYACQDAEFDRKAHLASIPAWLGVPAALRVALTCHLLMIVMLLVLPWVASPHLRTIYLIGVAAVAVLLVYEHHLVSPSDLSRVNQAFFNVNAVVSLGLFLLVLVQLLVGV